MVLQREKLFEYITKSKTGFEVPDTLRSSQSIKCGYTSKELINIDTDNNSRSKKRAKEHKRANLQKDNQQRFGCCEHKGALGLWQMPRSTGVKTARHVGLSCREAPSGLHQSV
jgi:hypothetical protein